MAKKLIKLEASWCGPCKVLGVRLKKLGLTEDQLETFDGESEEFKNSGYSKPKSYPTVLVVEDGVIIDTIEGVKDTQVYADALK